MKKLHLTHKEDFQIVDDMLQQAYDYKLFMDGQEEELGDDELELVSAAGSIPEFQHFLEMVNKTN